jgi:hypothetical protein
MWGYQLHDRPILDTLIQPSETCNYQRLSRRSRETRVRTGRWILPTSTCRARRVLLHAVNLRHGTDGFTSPPKEGVLRISPVLPFFNLPYGLLLTNVSRLLSDYIHMTALRWAHSCENQIRPSARKKLICLFVRNGRRWLLNEDFRVCKSVISLQKVKTWQKKVITLE